MFEYIYTNPFSALTRSFTLYYALLLKETIEQNCFYIQLEFSQDIKNNII